MKTTIQNKVFSVSYENKEESVSVKIEHKGRYQNIVVPSKKPWAKMTPKRAEESVVNYLMTAPEKRVANLLSYKTVAAVAKLREKLS